MTDNPPHYVYLGADVQTTGVAFAAIDTATGAVMMHGWRDIVKGDPTRTLEMQAVEIVAVMQAAIADSILVPVSLSVERVGGGRGVQSMLAVADAAGVVAGLMQAAWDTRPMWRPRPAEWKQACGMPGNAGKAQVRAHIADMVVPISGAFLRGQRFDDLRQDIVDAIGIASGDRAQSMAAVSDARAKA